MKSSSKIKSYRCAIYTRKSHEEGLEQKFNSLDAQRESGEAYIRSQQHEQWKLLPKRYDDGGFSGGNMERPALKQLLDDIAHNKIDIIMVYKVDRLSRSLGDFAKLMELFDKHGVSFVSVTQQFNTTNSMGRLTLNMLLSFAQFEREVTSERIRDKLAASKKKGMWMGGTLPFGYIVQERKLIVDEDEAAIIRTIYQGYLNGNSPLTISANLNQQGITNKQWTTQKGNQRGGGSWVPKQVYRLLTNTLYIGKIKHKNMVYDGEHQAIISQGIWDKARKAIQKQDLHHNQYTEKRLSGSHPLKGLLRLDTGEAFSPSSSKGTRYYVSQKAIKQGYKNCELKALNAGLLEDIVFVYVLNTLPLEVKQHLLKEYQQSKSDGWIIIRNFIKKITISASAIWLELNKQIIHSLKAELAELTFNSSGGNEYEREQLTSSFEVAYPAEIQENDITITCKVAVQIKRHNGRRYILAPDGQSIVLPNSNNPSFQQVTYQSTSILQAVSEVHVWKVQLEKSGLTVKQLAVQIGKSDKFIHGRLKLLLLSPSILKHVLSHSLSPIISLKDLLQAANSLDWRQQHRYLSIHQ